MIPLPQIVAELIMALGGALAVANIFALRRPRIGASDRPQRVQARGRVLLNVFIGVLVFVWGLASFLARS
jgi:hypothetical protein